MTATTSTKTFRSIKVGAAFQLNELGPVFVKCRGGFRPGRGGELHYCSPNTQVIPYGATN